MKVTKGKGRADAWEFGTEKERDEAGEVLKRQSELVIDGFYDPWNKTYILSQYVRLVTEIEGIKRITKSQAQTRKGDKNLKQVLKRFFAELGEWKLQRKETK